MALYFIAIVAPETINRQVLEWKHYMQERFHCKAALRSPAHITLIPPFSMQQGREKEMADALRAFAGHQPSFAVQLQGFSSFAPRVIYVDVQPNPRLQRLKKDIGDFLIQWNRFPIKKEERPFHPHVTIANRDLQKEHFPEAWAHFRDQLYEVSFEASAISLLRYETNRWEIAASFAFNP